MSTCSYVNKFHLNGITHFTQILIFYLLTVGTSFGATFTVSNLNDSGPGSYRAAINNCTQNLISQNSISCNSVKGIDLNGVGNDDYQSPVITAFNSFGVVGTAQPSDIIELFYDNGCSQNCQGEQFITSVNADGAGNWSYLGTLDISASMVAVAISTLSPENNTSEAVCKQADLPVECAKAGEPANTDCDCCPGLVALSPGPTCFNTGSPGLKRAFFMGRDTSHCGPISFNLFPLLDLFTSGNGDAEYGSLRYGTTFNNYPDTITLDVMVNASTTFFLENISPDGCVDTAMIVVNIEIPPDAGMNNNTAVCSGSIVDLTTLISVTGGIFEDPGSTGSLSGSDFNTSGLLPGNYLIDYIALGGTLCTNDTADITITVDAPVDAGTDNVATECDGEIVDLTTLVSMPNGSFSEEVASGGLNGNQFNTMNLSSGSYEVDYVVMSNNSCPNDTAVITITVINDMTCLMDISTTNTITFMNPCRCDNPLNSDINLVVLLEDSLVLMGPSGQLVVFEAMGSSGFFDVNGDPIADQTAFIENPAGTYKLQFYQLSGQQPIVNLSLNQGPLTQVDPSVFGMCICALIPTLSQWGLIILTLIFLIIGSLNIKYIPDRSTLNGG